MTPEEACEYLGISLDDTELDLNKIERNYEAGLKYASEDMRMKIEEAHKILLEVYAELYGQGTSEEKHEGMLVNNPMPKGKGFQRSLTHGLNV